MNQFEKCLFVVMIVGDYSCTKCTAARLKWCKNYSELGFSMVPPKQGKWDPMLTRQLCRSLEVDTTVSERGKEGPVSQTSRNYGLKHESSL